MHSDRGVTFSTQIPGERMTMPIETQVIPVDDLTDELNSWNSRCYDLDKLVQHTSDSYLAVFKLRPNVTVTYAGGRSYLRDSPHHG